MPRLEFRGSAIRFYVSFYFRRAPSRTYLLFIEKRERGVHRHGFLYYTSGHPDTRPRLFICEAVRLTRYRELYYAHERLLAGWLAAMLLGT